MSPSAAPAPASAPPAARPRVGMVGAGQLARMTHAAAIDLDIELVVLATRPDEPAAAAGARCLVGSPDDPDALARLADASDVVTFDHEGAPPELLRALEASGHVLRPSAEAKLAAQDKLHALERLHALGAPVPAFAPAPEVSDVEAFARSHGWPVVLKACRGGYDGRGVEVVADTKQARGVLERGGAWLVEERVAIERELAALVARRPAGDAVAYPVAETHQRAAMARQIDVPAPVAPAVRAAAEELALELARALDATGVLAVELFLADDGRLLVNELALRPHNSGHPTIEGTVTSQFHNHLRGVLDWPLGSTDPLAPAVVCVNVIGPADGSDPRTRLAQALAVPGAHVHLYGKQPAPGRKLGHVTVLGEDLASAGAAGRRAAELLTGEAIP